MKIKAIAIQQQRPYPWDKYRCFDSMFVELKLRKHFEEVYAYRFDKLSIRLLVIDKMFNSLKRFQKMELIDTHLDRLPKRILCNLISVTASCDVYCLDQPNDFWDN